jgi:hypothetical protein
LDIAKSLTFNPIGRVYLSYRGKFVKYTAELAPIRYQGEVDEQRGD